MKAKEREAKKVLSLPELRSEVAQAREKRFRLRFKHQVTPSKNPVELRTLRRDIARLETWIRQRESAESEKAS